MRRYGIVSITAAAILSALMFAPGCGDRTKSAGSGARPEIKGVAVTTIAPSTVQDTYETSATLKARMTTVVASRVFGTVSRLYSREGDHVQAGQILVAIDDRDARERLNAAEAGYGEALKARQAVQKQHDLAMVTAGRYANLYKEKVISQQEFDQIETEKKVAALNLERADLTVGRAKAILEEARIHHDHTRVKAPYPGIVTERKIEEGDMATPGAPLLTIEDNSLFKVEARVDEQLIGTISKGTPVRVSFDTPGRTIDGVLSRVVPAIDPGSRTFLVEAVLKGKTLKSGLYGRISIPRGTRQALIIPRSAVIEKGSLTGVYAVDAEGVARYRLIRKGKDYGQGVEVLSGLGAGERIIVKGAEKASDGGIVKVEKKGVNAP